jgi:hypothetical protein
LGIYKINGIKLPSKTAKPPVLTIGLEWTFLEVGWSTILYIFPSLIKSGTRTVVKRNEKENKIR